MSIQQNNPRSYSPLVWAIGLVVLLIATIYLSPWSLPLAVGLVVLGIGLLRRANEAPMRALGRAILVVGIISLVIDVALITVPLTLRSDVSVEISREFNP